MGLSFVQGRSFIVSGFIFTKRPWQKTRSCAQSTANALSAWCRAFVCVSVCLFASTTAFASSSFSSPALSLPADIYKEERERFLAVEKKLLTYSKRRLDQLDNEIYALADYPLYPYLLRLKLDRTLSIRNKREVA
jgi:hypothetical protein